MNTCKTYTMFIQYLSHSDLNYDQDLFLNDKVVYLNTTNSIYKMPVMLCDDISNCFYSLVVTYLVQQKSTWTPIRVAGVKDPSISLLSWTVPVLATLVFREENVLHLISLHNFVSHQMY